MPFDNDQNNQNPPQNRNLEQQASQNGPQSVQNFLTALNQSGAGSNNNMMSAPAQPQRQWNPPGQGQFAGQRPFIQAVNGPQPNNFNPYLNNGSAGGMYQQNTGNMGMPSYGWQNNGNGGGGWSQAGNFQAQGARLQPYNTWNPGEAFVNQPGVMNVGNYGGGGNFGGGNLSNGGVSQMPSFNGPQGATINAPSFQAANNTIARPFVPLSNGLPPGPLVRDQNAPLPYSSPASTGLTAMRSNAMPTFQPVAMSTQDPQRSNISSMVPISSPPPAVAPLTPRPIQYADNSLTSNGQILAANRGAVASDEQLKTNIQNRNVSDFLNAVGAYSYQYKNPVYGDNIPGKTFYGPMAQELEKSAIGKSAVLNTPQGKMVDTGRLTLINTSALAEIYKRLKQLETK